LDNNSIFGARKMFKNKFLLDELFLKIEDLFAWIVREKQQAEELALQIEEIVHQLSKLPPVETNKPNLISTLSHIHLLLNRFVEQPELFEQPQRDFVAQFKQTPIEITSKVSLEPPPVPEIEPEPELSSTAKELIKLRDWVLLAKSGEGKPSPEVLSAIYQKLGQILEQEGVTAIEETGSFNYERQQVVATQVTDDPEKDDLICDTVRPGYLFQGKLVRPQEAIVYVFERSLSSPQ
jgi:hypothetical protein